MAHLSPEAIHVACVWVVDSGTDIGHVFCAVFLPEDVANGRSDVALRESGTPLKTGVFPIFDRHQGNGEWQSVVPKVVLRPTGSGCSVCIAARAFVCEGQGTPKYRPQSTFHACTAKKMSSDSFSPHVRDSDVHKYSVWLLGREQGASRILYTVVYVAGIVADLVAWRLKTPKPQQQATQSLLQDKL